ncbi:MAG: NAD(P)/FAD-dependent oxidoreductase [Oscillospiraceae bacterium]|nr:NAD(P)/FAD-dependent oxidoreductase [Oscillospiraceae bacterium]
MKDLAIIGAGICGAAVAYEASQYDLDVCVIEEKNDAAMGTTRANSAVIHAGYDPPPGTLMAQTNVRGNELAGEICARLGVHFKRVGSLVVALNEQEKRTVEALYARGVQNGVRGMRLLDAAAAQKKEPHINPDVVCALFAPSAGIVNPWQYCIAMCNFAQVNGTQFFMESPVRSIERIEGGFRIGAGAHIVEARCVVNAAGLYADRVNALIGGDEFHVRPVRGEYYLLDKAQGDYVGSVVFPCPSKAGKGALVAPTVHGNLIVGPNAEPIGDPADTATTLAGQDDVRALVQRTVPGIVFRDNIRNFAGNRAYIIEQEDFYLAASPRAHGFINMAGIKSPGLTSAPALAELALGLLAAAGLPLRRKTEIHEYRFPTLLRDMSAQQQTEKIMQDPRYARVICRCETVTEGDIAAALADGFTPPTVSAVKRRCNAGMGRCQGGFCSMRVHEIIARERNIPPEAVTLDGPGSYIILGGTKEEL